MRVLLAYVIGGWEGKVTVEVSQDDDPEAIFAKGRADVLARNPSLRKAAYEQWENLGHVPEAS